MSQQESPSEKSTEDLKSPSPETTEKYQRPQLGHLIEWELKVANAESLNLISQALVGIDRSLETLADQGNLRPTTLSTTSGPGLQTTPEPQMPKTEVPVQGNNKEIVLADGRSAPADVVRALAEYDEGVWPGALVPEARAAIAHVVLSTVEKTSDKNVLKTTYPFCFELNPDTLESPCIKRKNHHGKHADNNDGVW